MLGLKSFTHIPIPSISRPRIHFPSIRQKTHLKFPKTHSRFLLFAQNNKNDQIQEPNNQKQQNNDDENGGGGGLRENGNPLFNVKLGDLILDPDPDNILAVALTGLLAWASAQVLWQLFIVSCAILVAALKYSVIAALLVFILITLL